MEGAEPRDVFCFAAIDWDHPNIIGITAGTRGVGDPFEVGGPFIINAPSATHVNAG